MHQKQRLISLIIVIMVASAGILSCSGQLGPEGPTGPTGPQGLPGAEGRQGLPGEPGLNGRDGVSYQPPTFVGSQTCAECHQTIYDVFMSSGHPWKLNPVVNGQPPDYPFSEIPSPPEGYSWSDISYVIGGYNWKARFIDQNGYIITGADENATTQYNLPNPELELGDNWVNYHAGEQNLPYDCGTCHTTGYIAQGNQNGMPGLIGSWALDGIQCEECHGPGSLHANTPLSFQMEVDRDAEACGACHVRGSSEQVNAKNGFIEHHEQYEELFQSKHVTIDCVVCHDPHEGVVQLRQANQQTTRTSCENCHFAQAKNQANQVHLDVNIDCIDCHMPRLVKSAVGDAERFTGDIRTHLVAIDPTQVGQFNEDGTVALSQLSLDFACRHCHISDGLGLPKTDEELMNTAINYHRPPEPTVVPTLETTTP